MYCYNYHGLQPVLGSATKRKSRGRSTAAKDKKTESQYHRNMVPLKKSLFNNKDYYAYKSVCCVHQYKLLQKNRPQALNIMGLWFSCSSIHI